MRKRPNGSSPSVTTRTRAGAQIVFLHILRWLREHHDAEISLLLNADGALLDDYAAVLPTAVLPTRDDATTAPRAMAFLPPRARRRLRPQKARLAPIGIEPGSVDLIYANSIASAHLAASLSTELRCPVICHVHELEMSIRRFTSPTKLRDATRRIDRYIAVSRAVERNLVANHDIDATHIVQIPECIPIPSEAPDPRDRARLRTELGIPLDAFVVGGCGTVDWRKGPDAFLLVAKAVATKGANRPVHFVWVGGEPRQLQTVEYDLDRLGLRNSVHFIGSRPDPNPYFALFDTFFLSSREDPFPLVCLEAAAMGAPIVCFADAGGMPEFVEDDSGYVVDYLDVDDATNRLLALANSESTRATLGRRAAAKVAERCSVDVVGPQIATVLDGYLHC